MTTVTIHRIDVVDLRSFRLVCGHCKVVTGLSLQDWSPANMGDDPQCPSCRNGWGTDGQAFKRIAADLKAVQERRAIPNGITGGGRLVSIQVEIPAQPERVRSEP